MLSQVLPTTIGRKLPVILSSKDIKNESNLHSYGTTTNKGGTADGGANGGDGGGDGGGTAMVQWATQTNHPFQALRTSNKTQRQDRSIKLRLCEEDI